MANEHLGSWERAHRNGARALVFEVLWTKTSDAYAFGVQGVTGVQDLGRAIGFGNAKVAADRESGCPQPCGCGPWFP
jgi:hypothetical protein